MNARELFELACHLVEEDCPCGGTYDEEVNPTGGGHCVDCTLKHLLVVDAGASR